MYEFIDKPVTGLDRGGRFLIWSMRSWVAAMGDNQCPAPLIAPAFARWRMIGGLQPFHRAMLILNRDALEPVAFCQLRCNHISEHEAVILSLICSLGDRGPLAVRETLHLLIAEEGVGDMLAALCALATAMDGANILPERTVRVPGTANDG